MIHELLHDRMKLTAHNRDEVIGEVDLIQDEYQFNKLAERNGIGEFTEVLTEGNGYVRPSSVLAKFETLCLEKGDFPAEAEPPKIAHHRMDELVQVLKKVAPYNNEFTGVEQAIQDEHQLFDEMSQ